jgi:hypothetical protein
MAGKLGSFALHEVEHIPVPEVRYPIIIGRTMIFGLDQLDPVTASERADIFVLRWRAAMSFQMGAEEFEKFCLRHASLTLP